VQNEYAELLSLAVHELRTPASVVSGYLRMLVRDDAQPLSERQLKMISEADKSCQRIVELIGELNDIAKLDQGTLTVKDEPFDLFHALEDVAGSVHESEDREVHLQLRGDAAGAPVRGDLARTRTAFAAFFRAILREQPSSTVVVADRRCVQKDDGPFAVVVIAAEQAVEQASRSRPATFVEKRGGLGLALPIARRVIERQGGRVWSPSDGAEASPNAIIVSLPVHDIGRRPRIPRS
jgi:signal transduction histidine kinase